jgi:quinoprotein glucose dehydrogenase
MPTARFASVRCWRWRGCAIRASRRSSQDSEESLRYEAARAIYGEPIDGAMEALAKLAYDETPDAPGIDWRALNANRMIGEVENAEALVHVANSANHPAATRREALAILAEWPTPHGQDRVFGNWRPCTHPHADIVLQAFGATVEHLLADDAVAAEAAKTTGALRLTNRAGLLAAYVAKGKHPSDARIAALDALAAMSAPELAGAVDSIDAAAPVPLRKRAVELMSHAAPEKAVPVLATLLDNASVGEQQAAFAALGDMQHASASALLGAWLTKLQAGTVPAALQLDLLEAAAKHAELKAVLTAREATEASGGPLAAYQACLDGGDAKAGRSVFYDFEATRCTRCHTLGGQGGNAGPVLDGIGKKQTREYLLAALIAPSTNIAEGFGAMTIELHNGDQIVGVVTKDQDGEVTVVGGSGEPVKAKWSDIKKRTPNGTSAMPPMGGPLSKRQIRDVLAFLTSQQ